MFQFRLKYLLQLRRTARDHRRTELAQAYQAEQVLKGQMEDLLREQQQLEQTIRDVTQPGSVPADQLLSAHRYQLLLRSRLRTLQQRNDQVGKEIEHRRQLLLESERDFRVMEKLREKQRTQHQRELSKREWKQLDEVALYRAQRTEVL